MLGWDKLLHVLASFALGTIDPWLAVAAGIGKEVLDLFTGGMADVADLVADGLGILASLWLA
ncbi:MAG: hypothetical protein HYV27_06230 [Candidatus Hydrogenedentes bacterium]|nr:hypothetical protein [Candidatus Hydrogenedentota bacterium]